MIDNFFQIENHLKPAKGRILIAEPFLEDYYFKRSIILLTEHNDEGSVGFVINNPVELKLSEALPGFPDCDVPISLGGPVGTDSIQFIHTKGDLIPDSQKIKNGLYWGGSFLALKNALEEDLIRRDELLFFVGYSGWSPNQLNNEIDQNSWLVTELTLKMIMTYNRKDLWKKSLMNLGDKYKSWANIPEDPVFN